MAVDQLKAAEAAQGAEPILLSETRGAVGILTLNRARARNSLCEALMEELRAEVLRLGDTPGVRAIILTAVGPAFCAGHDLKELTARRSDPDRGRAYFEKIMRLCADLMQTIVKCPKPVIAAVQATATAAGCQLVASCDLAVASDQAKFCTPGVNIGLFCSTPMVALSRNVPRKRAMEMLLLGEMISARDAADYGLVNRVAACDKVLEEAFVMAEKIAEKSSVTVAIGKEAFYRQIEMGLEGAYDYAAEVMVRNMLERDAQEGIGAFLDKRPPSWQGR